MLLTETVTLTGAHVRLEPLHADHADDLRAASAEFDERPWYTSVPAPEQVDADIATRLALRDVGSMNPFAVRRLSDDRIVGETTYCNIDQPNRRVEVGHTWLAPSVQRSAVNAEAKLLMFEHAFDRCDVIAVALLTHWLNRQSRRRSSASARSRTASSATTASAPRVSCATP